MRQFHYRSELWLPQSRDKLFQFFGDAFNLEAITPSSLRFKVLTPAPIRIAAGTRIRYRLRIHGIPCSWESEITAWEPPSRFIDEQRRGPYRLWRHEHRFEEKENGTRCLDDVAYAVPGGSLINWLFVRRELEKIFRFRREKLQQLFGAPAESVI